MPKKPSRKTMIRKIDKICSAYIRQRDTNKAGYGKCCTCDKILHISKGHAGHFMSRRFMATRYDPQNIHLQCPYCNTFLGGRAYEYSKFIDNKYGKNTADYLLERSRNTVKYSVSDLQEIYQKFKNLLTDF